MEIEAFCRIVEQEGDGVFPSPSLAIAIETSQDVLAQASLSRVRLPADDEELHGAYSRAFQARQSLVEVFGEPDPILWPSPNRIGNVPVMCQVPADLSDFWKKAVTR